MRNPPLPEDHAQRIEHARLALDGLSVGDGFGGQFFKHRTAEACLAQRRTPSGTWGYTDDTEMALAIFEVLERHGHIHQDDLAAVFARRYAANMYRGYGPSMHHILPAIGRGVPWQTASRETFDGQGSLGNGSAMRVAPVGAYFADDFDRVVKEARASAEVTHAHPDGAAGAIATAIAAAYAWRFAHDPRAHPGTELLRVVTEHTPEGPTRNGLERALRMPLDADVEHAAYELGNGSRVRCEDTVPFCLWVCARHLDSYREAMWTTVSAGGDVDTTAAIVGGIVALAVGREGIPAEWLAAREALDFWGGREVV